MLLFYLALAWSIIIEVVFWRRRFALYDFGVIALMLIGIVTIHRFSLDFKAIGSSGDLLALLSGFFFSIGAALAHGTPKSATATVTFVLVVSSTCFGLGAVYFFGPEGTVSMGSDVWANFIALATGILFLAPVMFGTVWAANILRPSELTSLLTLEIISGVISGAVLSGQAFGVYEALGSLAIIAAIIFSNYNSNLRAQGA